jgi:hypothetical protein
VRVCTAQEEHGGGKRLIRVRYRVRFRGTLHLVGWAGVAAAAFAAAIDPVLAWGVAAGAAGFLAAVWRRGRKVAGRVARVFDLAAAELKLIRCENRD